MRGEGGDAVGVRGDLLSSDTGLDSTEPPSTRKHATLTAVRNHHGIVLSKTFHLTNPRRRRII
jgi:hypothetical protein